MGSDRTEKWSCVMRRRPFPCRWRCPMCRWCLSSSGRCLLHHVTVAQQVRSHSVVLRSPFSFYMRYIPHPFRTPVISIRFPQLLHGLLAFADHKSPSFVPLSFRAKTSTQLPRSPTIYHLPFTTMPHSICATDTHSSNAASLTAAQLLFLRSVGTSPSQSPQCDDVTVHLFAHIVCCKAGLPLL